MNRHEEAARLMRTAARGNLGPEDWKRLEELRAEGVEIPEPEPEASEPRPANLWRLGIGL